LPFKQPKNRKTNGVLNGAAAHFAVQTAQKPQNQRRFERHRRSFCRAFKNHRKKGVLPQFSLDKSCYSNQQEMYSNFCRNRAFRALAKIKTH